jgi:hypothetical protein
MAAATSPAEASFSKVPGSAGADCCQEQFLIFFDAQRQYFPLQVRPLIAEKKTLGRSFGRRLIGQQNVALRVSTSAASELAGEPEPATLKSAFAKKSELRPSSWPGRFLPASFSAIRGPRQIPPLKRLRSRYRDSNALDGLYSR